MWGLTFISKLEYFSEDSHTEDGRGILYSHGLFLMALPNGILRRAHSLGSFPYWTEWARVGVGVCVCVCVSERATRAQGPGLQLNYFQSKFYWPICFPPSRLEAQCVGKCKFTKLFHSICRWLGFPNCSIISVPFALISVIDFASCFHFAWLAIKWGVLAGLW